METHKCVFALGSECDVTLLNAGVSDSDTSFYFTAVLHLNISYMCCYS